MITVAITAMLITVIAVHIGLLQTLCAYAAKIADCAKCSTFWAVLITVLCTEADAVCAFALATLMAYLSHFAMLPLSLLQKLYDWLWQKLKRKKW